MAVGDDVTEDYVTSLRLSSGETKQSGNMLSPELAWADSCLIKDPVSDSSWESLRDALLETLHSQTNPFDFEKHEDFPKGADIGMTGVTEETGISQNQDKAVDNNASTSEGVEKSDDDHIDDNNDTFWSRINLEKVFRPTYNENHRDIGTSETDLDPGFPAFVFDQAPEDIFKVWDLGTPDEEDELIQQLNKALTESSLEPSPPVSDDSSVSKDLKEVEDLISGLADLSLIEDSA